MKYYLNLDDNNYLLSIATVGNGIEANINLNEFDLSGNRIGAHKWDGKTLIFDADKHAEIIAEKETVIETKITEELSVYDELAAAYKEGVQEA